MNYWSVKVYSFNRLTQEVEVDFDDEDYSCKYFHNYENALAYFESLLNKSAFEGKKLLKVDTIKKEKYAYFDYLSSPEKIFLESEDIDFSD